MEKETERACHFKRGMVKATGTIVQPKRLRNYKSALDLVWKGILMTSEYSFSEVMRTEAKMQWFKEGNKRLKNKT